MYIKEIKIMTIQVLKPKFHIDECLDAIKECLEKASSSSMSSLSVS